jgi:predicted secreted protein
MAKFNGTDLLVYVNGTPIAFSQSASLEVAADLPDASTKDDGGWADHIHGQRSWSVTTDGLADLQSTANVENLFDQIVNRTDVTLKFSTSTTGDVYFTGTASVESVSINADNENPGTLSVSFKGKGQLTKATV